MQTITIRTHQDAIAAVPHLLGFHPTESLVLMPFGPQLPVVRVDIPTTGKDRDSLWDESLRDVLGAHASRTSGQMRMAAICFTQDRSNAEVTGRDFAERLGEIGIGVPVRLWTQRLRVDGVQHRRLGALQPGRHRPNGRNWSGRGPGVAGREPRGTGCITGGAPRARRGPTRTGLRHRRHTHRRTGMGTGTSRGVPQRRRTAHRPPRRSPAGGRADPQHPGRALGDDDPRELQRAPVAVGRHDPPRPRRSPGSGSDHGRLCQLARWAGRSQTTCAASSSSMPWTWPGCAESRSGRSCIRAAAPSTPRGSSGIGCVKPA
jgi:hypothetical protein